ncbi:MAG: ATP-binding cassette domain-containing protein, partial [Oscillospiraceae bacterium]|nr:ATP-binding cassette domain-containing protein [Oscillospiraceae bacterium]
MSEYVLELKNVCKSFGATKANVDISLSVKPGELRGLVGENGSGKSTLINSISGIHRIDSGEMFINGEKYDPHSP